MLCIGESKTRKNINKEKKGVLIVSILFSVTIKNYQIGMKSEKVFDCVNKLSLALPSSHTST